MFFKRKERNNLNDKSISDVLIYYTLNLMGKPKSKVKDFIKELEFNESVSKKGTVNFTALLENNCVLGISQEENKVFKVNIWLNNKLSKGDLNNLMSFGRMHDEEYFCYNLKDESVKKYMIAFESKIY